LKPYPLVPQGKVVAQRAKDIDDTRQKVEWTVDVKVAGSAGSVTSMGLLALFISHHINGWVCGELRKMDLSTFQAFFFGSDSFENLVNNEVNNPQPYENELISLDKYKGGKSEYITVITYTNTMSGAISLFKTRFKETSSTQMIERLDLVAHMQDVPREIYRVLPQFLRCWHISISNID
jgi:hypothetical protein